MVGGTYFSDDTNGLYSDTPEHFGHLLLESPRFSSEETKRNVGFREEVLKFL